MFSFLFALWVAKILGKISRRLNLGAGETWPGHLALKIDPEFLSHLESRLKGGSILISGTNGKTTTAHILSNLLEQQGYYVVHNISGANLVNGLTSALLREASLLGYSHFDFGVFEIDEGNLPHVLKCFTPEVIVLLNLSRDQLDRYGEVDLTLEKWEKALKNLTPTTRILINDEDTHLRKLGRVLQGSGNPLAIFNGTNPVGFSSPLSGRFNQLNTHAAVGVALLLGLGAEKIRRGLVGIVPAFGRGEELRFAGKRIRILLAKNPASFNENLDLLRSYLPETLVGGGYLPPLLIVLNDHIPDGRDVSWIYDVDLEKHRAWLFRSPLFVAGRRAYDLALRLKYAGLPIPFAPQRVNDNLDVILRAALAAVPDGEVLNILPTYSAMLEVRKILLGRAVG